MKNVLPITIFVIALASCALNRTTVSNTTYIDNDKTENVRVVLTEGYKIEVFIDNEPVIRQLTGASNNPSIAALPIINPMYKTKCFSDNAMNVANFNTCLIYKDNAAICQFSYWNTASFIRQREGSVVCNLRPSN